MVLCVVKCINLLYICGSGLDKVKVVVQYCFTYIHFLTSTHAFSLQVCLQVYAILVKEMENGNGKQM